MFHGCVTHASTLVALA